MNTNLISYEFKILLLNIKYIIEYFVNYFNEKTQQIKYRISFIQIKIAWSDFLIFIVVLNNKSL